jgi:SAM-dependent methyltransferase
MDRPDTELLPPPELLKIGGNTPDRFRRVGARWLSYVIELCGLEPDGSVLDLGSGTGRLAIPLTGYLGPNGRYVGLDVIAPAIAWCSENITPRYPNFLFGMADVFNHLFNPEGKTPASEYVIPFDDAEFDVVAILFVFNYILPDGVDRYLSEVSRVLKFGGKALATLPLLNEESRAHLERTASERHDPSGDPKKALFAHDRGDHHISNVKRPEALVAHHEDVIVGLYEKHGLAVDSPIRYGNWPGRRDHDRTFLDLIVATQKA